MGKINAHTVSLCFAWHDQNGNMMSIQYQETITWRINRSLVQIHKKAQIVKGVYTPPIRTSRLSKVVKVCLWRLTRD